MQVAQLRYAGLAMLNTVGIRILNHYPVLFFNRPAAVTDNLQLESYSYRLNESLSPQGYAEALSSYKGLMLVLVGELDEAFYPNEFQGVLDSHAPHADFRLVEGTKHLDLPSSEETAILVNDWLGEISSKDR